MVDQAEPRPKMTVPRLQRMKAAREPIVMVTAYDHGLARLVDAAGVDAILVGDTLGMVVQGHASTVPVTLDDAIYHTRLVARATPRALVVGDLPFGSYQTSTARALESACRLVKDGGCEAVKLEGGLGMAATIAAIASADVPVMGHVGCTPQSIHRMGGFRTQGRQPGHRPGGRERVMADALAVEDAGAFAVVLEGIPPDLAEEITAALRIPTIGIGAGPRCDGQVRVLHDLLGLSEQPPPFVRPVAEVGAMALRGLEAFVAAVRAGGPSPA